MAEKYIPITILASFFIIFSLFIFIKKILFIKQAISTIGIVRTAGAGSLSRSTEGVYFQTVNFETEKGKTITITSTMGSSGNKAPKVLPWKFYILSQAQKVQL